MLLISSALLELTPITAFHFLRRPCMLSHVLLSVIPWTLAHQAPLSVGFSRLEYWSGLPRPPPGDLPNPGIELMSPVSPALAGGFFTTEKPGKLP